MDQEQPSLQEVILTNEDARPVEIGRAFFIIGGDFDTLLVNVGKEAKTYLSVEAGGKDLVGLSINLVGYYNNYSGRMQYDGESINLWAADNSNWRSSEYATSLEIKADDVSMDEFPKDWGASVRCVKDAE